jgi:hypothetical protein
MALIAYWIREGSFGETSLDDVRWAELVWFPAAIHDGDGIRQTVVDESANPAQRRAIEELILGKHDGTYFEIFASVTSTERETVFAPIEIEADRERRVARVRIDGLAETRIEPIKNPVTGRSTGCGSTCRNGFEFKQAEIANTATARLSGEVPLSFTLEGTHAQLNRFEWSNAA